MAQNEATKVAANALQSNHKSCMLPLMLFLTENAPVWGGESSRPWHGVKKVTQLLHVSLVPHALSSQSKTEKDVCFCLILWYQASNRGCVNR